MASNFLWSSAGPGELIGEASVAAGNLLNMAGHSLTNGQQVTVMNLQGGATALEPAAPYWVRGVASDVFQLAPSPGAPPMEFTSSGSVDIHELDGVHSARDMRHFSSLLMQPANNGLSTLSTVRAGAPTLTLDGFTLTFLPTSGTIQPKSGVTWTEDNGPYTWIIPAETTADIAPADSQERHDLVVVELNDTDVDLSGMRVAEPVVYTGTPGTGFPPAVPDNALEYGIVTVPAVGAPTLAITAPPAIAVGGIIPALAGIGRPPYTQYPGMTVWREDTGVLELWNGSGWRVMARENPPRVLCGAVAVSPTSMVDNDPLHQPFYYRGTANVSFPSGFFTTTPTVTLSAHTAAVGVVMGTGVSGQSASGFTAHLARSSTTSTTVSWIAVQNG